MGRGGGTKVDRTVNRRGGWVNDDGCFSVIKLNSLHFSAVPYSYVCY